MATVRVADIVVTHREVTIPEKCPKCATPFATGDDTFHLVERNLGESTFPARLDVDLEIDICPDEYADCQTDWLVIGYECGECGHVLVEGTHPGAE